MRPGAKRAAQMEAELHALQTRLNTMQALHERQLRSRDRIERSMIGKIERAVAQIEAKSTPSSWWRGLFIRMSGIDIKNQIVAIRAACAVTTNEEQSA